MIQRIKVENPLKILDIGCGPGNSTYELKKKYPNAYIIGIDSSQNMIDEAKKKYPDLEFIKVDASKELDKLDKDFDIVFSNACIQWIDNHYELIPNMFSLVKENGCLAVQIPYNLEEPVRVELNKLSLSEKWKNKVGHIKTLPRLTEIQYYNILSSLSNDFSIFKIIYNHDMPGVEAVIEWFKGSALRPYLDCLTIEDSKVFLEEYYDMLVPYFPKCENGHILLPFPRLFFIVYK